MCPRLGKAVQLSAIPGMSNENVQVTAFTAGSHQLVAPLMVHNNTYAGTRPAIAAALDSGRWRPAALSVEDQGATVSFYDYGERFKKDISTVTHLANDSMHLQTVLFQGQSAS